jgi:hypothetical protein
MTRRLGLVAIAALSVCHAGCGGDEKSTAGGGSGAEAGSGGVAGGGAGSSPGGSGGEGAGGAPDAGGGSGGTAGSGGEWPGPSPDYADAATWLCWPGASGSVCDHSLDATVVMADGSTEDEIFVAAAAPDVDCFYVYPTISLDPLPNSDLQAGDEEINVVRQQAARLGSACRVFAPIYRQVTLGVLFGTVETDATREELGAIAYGDVEAAWEAFRAETTDRPFVLVGHSQGAGHLRRLIQERIDDDDVLRGQMLSAYLIGTAVAVPEGADVGLDFDNVPACRSTNQTGCVVSYASYANDAPPPDDSLFGAPRTGGGTALCVNPAAPAGGSAPLMPYFAVEGGLFDVSGLDVSAPYVKLPDYVSGECVMRNGFSVLEVTIVSDAADPRPRTLDGRLAPNWGLHLIDMHLAMGDIESMLIEQVGAFTAP